MSIAKCSVICHSAGPGTFIACAMVKSQEIMDEMLAMLIAIFEYV